MILGLAVLHAALTPIHAQSDDAEPSHLGAYARTLEGLARPVAVAFPPAGAGNRLHIAVQGDVASPPGVVVRGVGPTASPEATLGVGVLERPTGVAVDADGGVWVTDALQHALWHLPAGEGAPRRAASRGSGEGEVVLPADVDVARDPATGGDLVLVAEAGTARALLFAAGWGAGRPIGRGLFHAPTAVTFAHAPDGKR
ncbi:MAG: hypothetical protein AAGB93_20640, partial [Planctomycetota bacterium]